MGGITYSPKPCGSCGRLFQPKRSDQRTCRAICRRKLNNDENNYKSRAPKVLLTCSICTEVFVPKRRDGRYCSKLCAQEAIRASVRVPPKSDRNCVVCVTRFLPARSDSKCCSTKCKWALHRRNIDPLVRVAHQQRREANKRRSGSIGVTAKEWRRILDRAQSRCFYCGVKSDRLQREHILPISKGGLDNLGNVVPSCPPCNFRKRNDWLVAWRYRRGGYAQWRTAVKRVTSLP